MRRYGIFGLVFLAAPVMAFARPLPPLACESLKGDAMLGLYGAVAQLKTPDIESFKISAVTRDSAQDWPVYMRLFNAQQSQVLRLTETECLASGGKFPLRAELYHSDTAEMNVFCCTVAE